MNYMVIIYKHDKISNNRVNEYLMSLQPDRLTFVMKYYI